MKKTLLFMLISAGIYAQKHELTILINSPKKTGEFYLGFYNNPEKFLEINPIVRLKVLSSKQEKTIAKISLEKGKYSIAMFQDLNSNQDLDKGMFGIPTELYGFSNNAKGFMGPPSFEKSSFILDKNKTIKIDLK